MARTVRLHVMANGADRPGREGHGVTIEVDLDDPQLRPVAAALAQCTRKGRIDARLRSVQTRQEMLDDMPAEPAGRLREKWEAYGLALDQHDEVRCANTIRYWDGAQTYGRTYETPVAYLNRVTAELVPAGWYPVGPWRAYGEPEVTVAGAEDAAHDTVRYLNLTQFAEHMGIRTQTLAHRTNLPPADAWIGNDRGWRPETVHAYRGLGQGHRSDLDAKRLDNRTQPTPTYTTAATVAEPYEPTLYADRCAQCGERIYASSVRDEPTLTPGRVWCTWGSTSIEAGVQCAAGRYHGGHVPVANKPISPPPGAGKTTSRA